MRHEKCRLRRSNLRIIFIHGSYQSKFIEDSLANYRVETSSGRSLPCNLMQHFGTT